MGRKTPIKSAEGCGSSQVLARRDATARRRRPNWLALLLGWTTLLSCAGLDGERNLAPLFSRYSVAGGGVGTEALGGAVLTHHDEGRLTYWAFRPLVSWRERSDTEEFTWFLPPLGSHRTTESERVTQLLPIARYASSSDPHAKNRWSLISLPGIYWAGTNDGRTVRAWFPFGGVLEEFLSFDRAEFILWPLWMRTQRHGRTTYHFPYPFLMRSKGAGGPAWRVWPFVGNHKWEGRYDKWFFLWPLFHQQWTGLRRPPSEHAHTFAAMPLFGHTRTEHLRSWSFLWPLFGYAKDSRSGFRALDAPWPLVRWRDPGPNAKEPVRKRFWPFYSYYHGDGLTSRYFAWPLINLRREEYPDGTKKGAYVFPFYRRWVRTPHATTEGADGVEVDKREAHLKIWPLYRKEEALDSRRESFPALNPLWPLPVIDEHYTWLWEIYTTAREGSVRRSRSWLGLWRREKDADEDRRSFSGLWSKREYSAFGEPISEMSFLFGLLRFRNSTSRGLQWRRPAFPGPGWPLERTPNSLRSDAPRIP